MVATETRYAEASERVHEVLRAAFGPNVAVHTDEGQVGQVFVKIVSDRFDGLSAREKQEAVWREPEVLGPDAGAVSLVLVFGTDEI